MTLCPKCSKNIGTGNTQCYACGQIVLPTTFTPYKKRSCEHVYSGKEYKQINRGKRCTCENCLRPDLWLTNKLCGACISQIRKNRYGM